MTSTPLTVVTICRNADKTIQKTFDSILNQSVKPAEYLIIDACSTDKTFELAKAMQEKATFPVHIIREKDRGISDAFNKGIRRSTQEWVHLLNADDFYWSEDSLAEFEKARVGSKAQMLVAKAGIETPKGDFFFEHRFGKDTSSVLTARISHPACIVRRSAYELAGMYNLTLKTAMDYELILRFEVIFGMEGFGFIHSPFVGVGYGGESIVNAARGYRELAGARMLYSKGSLAKILTRYVLSVFFFTTKIGLSLIQLKRSLSSTNKPTKRQISTHS